MEGYPNANWRKLILGEMLARVSRKQPEKLALVFEGTRLTFADLDGRVNRLANALASRGVAKGDKVAVLSYNSHRVVEAYFACHKLGAVAVPVNFRMVEGEVRYVLSDSGARTLLFGEGFGGMAESIVGDGAVALAVDMDGDAGGFAEGYERLVSTAGPGEPAVEVDDDDDAFIMYTSGTTGFPKGAVLTHKNLWMNTANWIMEMQVTGGSVWLSGLPLFHIGGVNGVLPFIYLGGTNVITPSGGFDPEAMLRLMEKERVTHCYFVPAQWQQFLELDLSRYDLGSLRKALWGASLAPMRVLEGMAEAFPSVEIVNAFGQTEMSSNTTFLKGEDAVRKMGSVGLPAVNVEVRIVDDENRDVPEGEVGEIVYRGPTVFKGYHNDPEATAEAFEGGWFHSGDLVRRDGEGYIYVVDRKKDMFISGGENIYPAEVERVISTHPAVAEVAVIGVPHEKWGETPKALVVPREGQRLTREEVIEHCRKHLAGYKKPTYVAFVEELPRNAAGKVLKRELRRLHGGSDDA
ncbi:AMP-dependent synthetase and ligase [Rubrobacter xylanophilus DSM 9941]|uniref:AMP-dependent synthetase and ligase n=1 Tax=Rubrobacter xylanophilus (strain DSM 9941 / JCM 11954 / NBRC 16129 / PRD-1) TaxID=266117 RepID=Q1AZ49_RUBXD|nr:long-chain fatty acid--CoA ligase [Rubrobacter xylanophilus]ABG03329.1 AMP-dependent synthetase and ligase [Rubrobacter xylanophilus DSM 9941]